MNVQNYLAVPPRSANNHVRFTSNVLRSLGILNDVLWLALAFGVTLATYYATFGRFLDVQLHVTVTIILSINFLLIRISRDAYSESRGQNDDVSQGAMLDLLVAVALTGLTILQLGLLIRFSRGMVGIYIPTALLFLYLGHMAFRVFVQHLMTAGYIGQRVVIYGADRPVAERVIELLSRERLPHLQIVGFADDRKSRILTEPIGELPFVGGFTELLDLARRGGLDQVIIALPKVQQERLDAIVEALNAVSVDVCMLPREVIELRPSYQLNFIGSMPVLKLWQQPMRDFSGIIKEIEDRGLSIIGLVVLSPLLLLTALAIKLDSKGPIFFVQKRFGFNNLEINVLKFRSMYVDSQDVTGAQRTTQGDPRVTRVGRIIRRLSIDELPQLWNVLRGDMSIVGPRPHATQMRVGDEYYFDAVRGYAARHRVRPGVTGLAQVRGLRGEISTIERAKKRVEYDVYYIENWSPLLDLRIILETFSNLIMDRNAY